MSSRVSQAAANSAILAQRHARDARRYFDRHGYVRPPELPTPAPGLGLVVVVPALAEPDVIATLDSVAAAARPHCAVELLLVVNAPDDACPDLRRMSTQNLTAASLWAGRQQEEQFRCHVLDYRGLPAKHAGVGLARKLGMDAGLARLAAAGLGRGVVVSLDADCSVAANYLTAVYNYFQDQPAALGATIYFEHPLEETAAELRAAIIEYELHMRCYKHGLHAAGSPYAIYTVGSAFAVRSEIYAQEGGMNRRLAGEDFYFINKLLKRGHVGEVNSTTVFPSARVSTRTPFGTGAALRRAAAAPLTTYAPAVYRELQTFQTALEAAVRAELPIPPEYAPFLDAMGFEGWLQKARANVASVESLLAHLRRWLDGLRTLKFIHWLTESRYPPVPVTAAAREIVGWRGMSAAREARGLLEQFRSLDRL